MSCGFEVAHGGINEGIACLPCLPGGEVAWFVVPNNLAIFAAVAFLHGVGMVIDKLIEKFSPNQFAEPFLCAFVLGLLANVVIKVADGDGAKIKVG